MGKRKPRRPSMRRDTTLKLLGYATYRDYLEGGIWKDIRERVLAKHERCYACGDDGATHVHHTNYRPAVLSGESLQGLMAICSGCHAWAHFSSEDGGWRKRPRNSVEASQLLRRRRQVRLQEEGYEHIVHERLDEAALQQARRAR